MVCGISVTMLAGCVTLTIKKKTLKTHKSKTFLVLTQILFLHFCILTSVM